MADIFISYAQGDREWVKELATALEAEGFSVWWDPNLVAGARYRETIDKELSGSHAVVVIWSNLSVHSDYVRDEAEDARLGNKLVPVLKDAVRVPAGFRQLQTTDLSQWRGRRESPEFQKLIGGIRYVTPAQADAGTAAGAQSTSTASRPLTYTPPPAPIPPPPRKFWTDGKIVGAAIGGVVLLVGLIVVVGVMSGKSEPGKNVNNSSTTTTTTSGGTTTGLRADLNSRVAIAVEAAERAEHDARDRASRAWTIVASARSAAQEAHNAAVQANANAPGYGVLEGKYDNGTGYRYEGQITDGKADGYGTLYIASSGYRYEGHWKMNQHDGLGVETFKNGDTFEAEFMNGDASGLGVYSFGTGQWAGDVYAGEFLKGALTGLGVYRAAASGEEDAGNRKDSNPLGYSVAIFKDGSRWEGEWKDNKLDGLAAKLDAAGHVTEEGIYSGGALKQALKP